MLLGHVRGQKSRCRSSGCTTVVYFYSIPFAGLEHCFWFLLYPRRPAVAAVLCCCVLVRILKPHRRYTTISGFTNKILGTASIQTAIHSVPIIRFSDLSACRSLPIVCSKCSGRDFIASLFSANLPTLLSRTMESSISDLAVLNHHPPRCLSLCHRPHHPYYPLDDCMDSDSNSTSDRDSDLNSADMQQHQHQQHSGALSLHHYRKALYSETDSCVVLDMHGRRKLKRKNGASNLHTPSVSGTSSPPPLSPSYSMTMSVTSQRSDVDQDGFGFCMLGSWSFV